MTLRAEGKREGESWREGKREVAGERRQQAACALLTVWASHSGCACGWITGNNLAAVRLEPRREMDEGAVQIAEYRLHAAHAAVCGRRGC